MAPLVDAWFQIWEGEQQFSQRCELRQAFLLQQVHSQSRVMKEDVPIWGQEVWNWGLQCLACGCQSFQFLPGDISNIKYVRLHGKIFKLNHYKGWSITVITSETTKLASSQHLHVLTAANLGKDLTSTI